MDVIKSDEDSKKKVLLSVSLITLSLALVLAPFTGAIEGDATAGNTTDGVWDIISDDILSDESSVASLGDSPTTWPVHPTRAHFHTIQSAIDNSAYGDSIEVWNGTYNKFVVLNKQLTIYSRDGANVTIIDAEGNGSAITIKADSCTVDGFRATGSGYYPGDAGIKVESNGNNIMNNFCCANKHNGIRLWNSSNNKILNNTCYANLHAGIYLEGCSNNIISYNKISDNKWDGLYISQSSDNVVSNNEICRNSPAGVYVEYSSNNRIYCNDFVNNSMKNVNSCASDSIWNSTRVYTYNGSRYTRNIGNYLSDYVGADNNRDGIGDEPYYSELICTPVWGDPGGMLENVSYPLIRPFKFYILENVLPIADFTFPPLDPIVNERVTFDASLSYDPDGAIILYQWDFGDGNITSMAESTITHYYRSTADYTVTLTVTDDSGAISSTSKVITIISKFLPLPPQPQPFRPPPPHPTP